MRKRKIDIIKIIRNDLKNDDGKVFFLKGEYCGGNSKCHGIFYFNNKDKPVIKVAKGNKTREQWLGILIHEYCHFLQWKYNVKAWKEFDRGSFSFDDVILQPKKNKRNIMLLLKLELDCEKRAVKLIKSNNLDINAQNYIQTANYILYKYAYLYKYYKWPTKHLIINEIIDIFPENFLMNARKYIDLPKEVLDLYSKN